MTPDEYQRICDRCARKAIRYAEEMAEAEDVAPDNVTSERDHWIDVYLNMHLPDIDPDVARTVTKNPDAADKHGYSPFEADVLDAIHAIDATTPTRTTP